MPLLNEKPYVEMTLDWLDRQEIEYKNQDFKRFIIRGGQHYKPFDSAIPGDFSTATFFMCAAAGNRIFRNPAQPGHERPPGGQGGLRTFFHVWAVQYGSRVAA